MPDKEEQLQVAHSESPGRARGRAKAKGKAIAQRASLAGETPPPSVAAAPEDTCCAITVRGHALALAMLRGSKPYENRRRGWTPGWYYLHVGGQEITPEHGDILRDTWPDAPDPKDLPPSCLVGMVRMGQGERKEQMASDSPWALGPVCYRIEEAIDFREVVKEKKRIYWNVEPIRRYPRG